MFQPRTRSTASRKIPCIYRIFIYDRYWNLLSSDLYPNLAPYEIPRKQVISDLKWIKNPLKKTERFNDKLRFLPVTNSKIDDSISLGVTHRDTRYYNSRYYVYEYSESYMAYRCGSQLSIDPPVLPAYDIGAAFKSLQPSYKDAKVDGINIYTVILELADLKKTFTKVTWSLSKTFKDIPEKNLAINFGILPVYGDICTMYDIVTKLGEYINTWNEGAKNGIVWDKHLNISFPAPGALVKPKVNGNIVGNHMWSIQTTQTQTTKAIAHLYYKPQLIDDAQRDDIYWSALGLDRPVLGVWEAVPFSWAIDYFLHVDKIIARFDEALPGLFNYEFVDAGYSIKSELVHQITYESVPYYLNVTPAILPKLVRFKIASHYKRYPVNQKAMVRFMSAPEDYQLGWDKGWKQASYLASVAYLMFGSRRK